MKTLLIVALLAIAATSAVAQLDIGYGELQWQQQPWQLQPWQLQLNPCRAFLQQQCSPVAVPFLRSRLFQLSSCQVMQQQCCQQLTQIAEQSRCQAICGVAQAIMQQQLGQSFYQPSFYQPQLEAIRAMALHTLPTMCNVFVPPHCATMVPYAGIPTTVPFAGIPTTATCAGGACF